ncbi:MAG: NAD(P)H-dependent oxidoreductase [Sphingobacteriales bacterium]|nr:MAG: NAD(P)H-dependent oxidoreductase [Sphingobacteriales bacterium]
MSLVENLNWRYATKAMNGAVVPQEKIDYILDAAHLSPSSSGLQPYKVIVVADPELKAKIQPIAFNQPQIVDGSHILIFASWDKYTEERVNAVFEHSNKERGLPASATDDYRTMLLGMFAGMSEADQAAHAAKQSYISFGIAAAAAAEQQVDATPMEGFNKEQLDELLGLNALGLKSATILALGYRDAENDWLVNMKKVRTPKDEFFIFR